ncbi:AAA family ATPase [Candidatus Kaiserbacteria bacterium]|nr:AAA family ATPase [Candidatus Kaiserbacteria bacterium]
MIIGITGTLGAGKGTVVKYLVEKHGFTHYSVRAYLEEEILRRNLPNNRDTMTTVANELRAQNGPGHIVEQLMLRAVEHGGDVVIESIRSVGEAEFLRAHGAHLWAVDADVKVRYERIVARASATDAVSYEKFVSDENREFFNSDPNKQNISGVVAMADVVINNDGTADELFAHLEEILSSLS